MSKRSIGIAVSLGGMLAGVCLILTLFALSWGGLLILVISLVGLILFSLGLVRRLRRQRIAVRKMRQARHDQLYLLTGVALGYLAQRVESADGDYPNLLRMTSKLISSELDVSERARALRASERVLKPLSLIFLVIYLQQIWSTGVSGIESPPIPETLHDVLSSSRDDEPRSIEGSQDTELGRIASEDELVVSHSEERPPQTKLTNQLLGLWLLDAGAISEKDLTDAVSEQASSGGELDKILVANGVVDRATVTNAFASMLALPTVRAKEHPKPLLPVQQARRWRAVALSNEERVRANLPLPVAFENPTAEAVEAVQKSLQRPIQPKLADRGTITRLLVEAYAEEDAVEATMSLYKKNSYLSAYRNRLSLHQYLIVAMLSLFFLTFGLMVGPYFIILVGVALASVIYVLYAFYRFLSAWIGWKTEESTVNPSTKDIQSLDERKLPTYTILIPLYKEKPSTLDALFRALSTLDYPKHKLDGLLLIEADDQQTQQAIEKAGQPRWLESIRIPPGDPRTKPKAMMYGLLYAQGSLLTVYDAEDQPDPYQLKKAVWAYQNVDGSVACLQAKLNYYNPRQNLLTRWFTLEYEFWFDLFLPGLHRIGAPIPLGGTSNHFRTSVLREALGWDPFNVTEDADLGLRLHRLGKRTLMLESTTYEEANSKLLNWLHQRSRWVKGYMQTFLVHTRKPLALYREMGLRDALIFLLTVGGYLTIVLMNPIFWTLLILWVLAQPGWVAELFPGWVYYLALISLLLGNFFFVLLSVMGAVGRGQDDLAPYTLLIPLYWGLMSMAAYLALFELILRPHYWRKTEHGLHFKELYGK